MAKDDPQTGRTPRTGRVLWITLIAIAGVVVAIAGGGAILFARFDPNSFKPRIVAAVRQATGRDLALNGTIGLTLSLRPTIEAHDVTFANPPGFSRPQMATLVRLDVQLALLPLLSKQIEIARLVLVHPDILLETDAQGRPNWQFTPPPQTEPAPQGSGSAGSGDPGLIVSAREVRIEDGVLAYRDGKTGQTTTLDVTSLAAKAESPTSPLHLVAEARFDGMPVTINADTGSLARLQDRSATTPWPVKLAAQLASARVSAEGALTQPLQGKGYTLAINGAVPDLMALAPLLPNGPLPPLRDISFDARVADSGTPVPTISALTLHAGASDLGTLWPALRLDRLDITAAALDQPVHADLAAKFGDMPLTLVATAGTLAQLMAGGASPMSIDATAEAAGARFAAKGSVANGAAISGVLLDLTATIPDLAALSPLARRQLPSITKIAFQGRLSDANGGLTKGAALHAITLTSDGGDLKGDVSIRLGTPMTVTAKLASARIDADVVSAASGTPLPAASGTPAPPETPPRRPAGPKGGRLFSDQPLPFGLLQRVNADIALTVGVLHVGGRDTKAINAHVVLNDGKLMADPLVADLPQGHLDAKVTADATQTAPPVGIVLRAPGLALRPLLAAAGLPDVASGDLEVYADLHGAGESPHAIAASLDGVLGLALANGTVDNRMLGRVVGPLLEKANIPDILNRGGISDIRCFALRMDTRRGIGTFRTLALSSSLLTMDGGGSVNLGEETLALRLRPQARVGGTGFIVPLRVSGAIRSPSVAMDPLATAEANAGTVAGAIIGDATPLGLLGGLLGADKLLGGGGSAGDACAAPLAVARGQPIPAAAAAAPQSTGSSGKQKLQDAEKALRQLFR